MGYRIKFLTLLFLAVFLMAPDLNIKDIRILSKERQACVIIPDPLSGDNFLVFKTLRPIEIKKVFCIVEDATNVTVSLQHCNDVGDVCTVIEALTCLTSGTEVSGAAIDSSSVSVNRWIRTEITGVSGTPGHVTICMDQSVV